MSFKKFGKEFKKVMSKLGEATEKTLKTLDNPKQKEIDAKMNEVLNKYQ